MAGQTANPEWEERDILENLQRQAEPLGYSDR